MPAMATNQQTVEEMEKWIVAHEVLVCSNFLQTWLAFALTKLYN